MTALHIPSADSFETPEQLAEWIITICRAFGAQLHTALLVAGEFVGADDIRRRFDPDGVAEEEAARAERRAALIAEGEAKRLRKRDAALRGAETRRARRA